LALVHVVNGRQNALLLGLGVIVLQYWRHGFCTLSIIGFGCG
jgi:hypothetical protein